MSSERSVEEVRVALETEISGRLTDDREFRESLRRDPKAAVGPLLVELVGDRVDLTAISVLAKPTEDDGIEVVVAEGAGSEVEGYGDVPIPYPDLGGGSGSTKPVNIKPGDGSSNVSAGVAKSILGVGGGKAWTMPSSLNVKFEGQPIVVTGPPR